MRRDRVRWAVVAVGSAALFVMVGWLTAHTGFGDGIDRAVTNVILRYGPAPLRRGLDELARPLAIVVLAPVVVVLTLLAVARRGWRRATGAFLIAVVSAILTLGLPLKRLLSLPDDSYPSDHATIGLGLVVALLLVWPSPVTRRGLAIAGVGALLIGLGNVSWYAHEVSDVVGSALLVAAVTGAVVVVLGSAATNVVPDVLRTRRDAPDDRGGDPTS